MMSATAGIENFAKDLGTQQYWMRRIIAYLFDAVTVWLALVLVGFEALSQNLLSAPPLAGPLLFVYSVVAEYTRGQTLGKWVMGLRVVGIRSKTDLSRLLIREISKAFFVFLLLDILAGFLATKNGRQRYLEVLSDTTQVVDRA